MLLVLCDRVAPPLGEIVEARAVDVQRVDLHARVPRVRAQPTGRQVAVQRELVTAPVVVLDDAASGHPRQAIAPPQEHHVGLEVVGRGNRAHQHDLLTQGHRVVLGRQLQKQFC